MTVTTGPDLAEFYKYSRPKRPPCRVGFVLTKLSRNDKKALEAALATDKNLITSSAIITWLEKRGIEDIRNSSPITGHRRRTCTCYDS